MMKWEQLVEMAKAAELAKPATADDAALAASETTPSVESMIGETSETQPQPTPTDVMAQGKSGELSLPELPSPSVKNKWSFPEKPPESVNIDDMLGSPVEDNKIKNELPVEEEKEPSDVSLPDILNPIKSSVGEMIGGAFSGKQSKEETSTEETKQSPEINLPNSESIGKMVGEAFSGGSKTTKTITNTLNKPVIGGAIGGLLGLATGDGVGSAVGGAAGGAIGTALGGPIGGLIGSTLGSSVGGAVSDTEKTSYTENITPILGAGGGGGGSGVRHLAKKHASESDELLRQIKLGISRLNQSGIKMLSAQNPANSRK